MKLRNLTTEEAEAELIRSFDELEKTLAAIEDSQRITHAVLQIEITI
jgi:hypothetical protein